MKYIMYKPHRFVDSLRKCLEYYKRSADGFCRFKEPLKKKFLHEFDCNIKVN